jgi:hypothetical protein
MQWFRTNKRHEHENNDNTSEQWLASLPLYVSQLFQRWQEESRIFWLTSSNDLLSGLPLAGAA